MSIIFRKILRNGEFVVLREFFMNIRLPYIIYHLQKKLLEIEMNLSHGTLIWNANNLLL